jgi:hypothetical protein
MAQQPLVPFPLTALLGGGLRMDPFTQEETETQSSGIVPQPGERQSLCLSQATRGVRTAQEAWHLLPHPRLPDPGLRLSILGPGSGCFLT